MANPRINFHLDNIRDSSSLITYSKHFRNREAPFWEFFTREHRCCSGANGSHLDLLLWEKKNATLGGRLWHMMAQGSCHHHPSPEASISSSFAPSAPPAGPPWASGDRDRCGKVAGATLTNTGCSPGYIWIRPCSHLVHKHSGKFCRDPSFALTPWDNHPLKPFHCQVPWPLRLLPQGSE